MKGTLIAIVIITLVGCAKSFHEVNKSYYHPIPSYWQVKSGEVIIERELDKRLKEYRKWIEEQNELGTS